jgi:DNA-binding transcriptional MerR regulator
MVPTKVYYSIKEVRKIVDLPLSTLRYWESQFEQLSPYKDEHGNRYYTEKDIELIKRIKFIRDDLHITRIEAIRTELKNDSRKTDVRQRATEILERVRMELAEIRSKI